MARHAAVVAVAAVAVAAAAARGAAAWRHFLKHMPNGAAIPCVDATAGGCVGGYCEAVGHEGCSGDGEVNAFGEAFAEDRDAAWTTAFCAADHDGDGYTTGDELGDGCCAWGGADSDLLHWWHRGPQNVSNPAEAASVPRAPSCTLAGAPPALPAMALLATASTALQLQWTPPPAACVCEVVVQVTWAAGAATLQARGDAPVVGVCGLPPATAVTVTVTPRNRAGGAAASPASVFTTAAAGTPPAFACTPALAAAAAAPPAVYMNTIPGGSYAVPTSLSAEAPTGGVVFIVLPFLLLSFAGCALQACGGSRAAAWLACGGCVTAVPCRLCLRRGCLRLPWLRDAAQASPAFVAAVALAAAGAGAAWAYTAAWYGQHMVYSPAQVSGATWRGAGYALALVMGLQLLPVTRWSPWMAAVGVSFERGIAFHRWLSSAALVLAAVHGVGFAVDYAAKPDGVAYLFVWSTERSVNALAGTLAGLCMAVMGLASLSVVRRAAYRVFLAGHALYPAVLLLAVLHLHLSESPALPLFAPGVALLVLDHVVITADYLLRPVKVMSCRVLGTGASAVVRLECIKAAHSVALARAWPFHYAPGQYVYLLVPGVSLVPHPFSISSAPVAGRAGWFTVHARVAGGSAFVARLRDAVTAASGGSGGGSSGGGGVVSAVSPLAVVRRPPPSADGDTLDAGDAGGVLLPTVRVAGPYGIPTLPLETYSHFVLFAGGIGITPIAPLHAALAGGQSVEVPRTLLAALVAGNHHRAAPLRFLLTAWSVREAPLAAEFTPALATTPDEEAAADGAKPFVSAMVYTGTAPAPAGGAPPAAGATTAPTPVASAVTLRSGMQRVAGRLPAKTLLDAAVTEIARTARDDAPVRVAVLVCGPQPLVDDVYYAASQHPQRGARVVVHVHKELFAF